MGLLCWRAASGDWAPLQESPQLDNLHICELTAVVRKGRRRALQQMPLGLAPQLYYSQLRWYEFALQQKKAATFGMIHTPQSDRDVVQRYSK
jgi:hypothetical protein